MSPRRNARAVETRRPAARGKTRALGQHFLRDTTVAHRIVDLVAPTPRDVVVEIGPGQGALTGLLARAAGRDPLLAQAIREKIRAVLVVQTEVELVPWGSLQRSEYKSRLVER